MRARWIYTPAVGLALFLLIIPPAQAAVYQPVVSLEGMCGRNVTIPCPTTYSGSAGTVRFYLIPDADCTVTLTLDKLCGYGWDTFALYMNIRIFVLPRSDSIQVTELFDRGRRILQKVLFGTQSGISRPRSVAQVLTSYSRQPAFEIYYNRGSSPSTYSHEAYFDYVIVEQESLSDSSYCNALSGYMRDDFICDTGGDRDRVNCPGNYVHQGSTVTNPAYSWQRCSSTVDRTTAATRTTTYYWSDWTTGYYPSDDYGLGAGAVVGIIIGVLIFVIFLAAVITAVASKRRSVARPVVFSSTAGTVSINHSPVGGNYVPPRAGSAPHFRDAPPSYAEVTAPNSHFPVPPASNSSSPVASVPNTGFPMPSVPKY